MRKTLLTLFFALLTVASWAYDVKVDGIYYNLNKEEGTAEVTAKDGRGYSGRIVIPEQITVEEDAYSVTSIGERAFSSCSNLESVEIPISVTSIGEYAFYGCTRLTSMEIPNSVTSIEQGVFSECFNMTSVEIPNSVTSIGNKAFEGCTSLTSVDIPNSVTSIGQSAFSQCGSLSSINIPNSVMYIGDNAFYGCNSLPVEDNLRYADIYLVGSVSRDVTTANIKEGTRWIAKEAFYECGSLSSISIPNSVMYIGENAFKNCNSLPVIDNVRYADTYLIRSVSRDVTTANIKEGTRWIGKDAFIDCWLLSTVTIPNTLISIDDGAFSMCRSLTSVNIPASVTTIGEGVFYQCSSLTSVEIPNSVKELGISCFRDCTSLSSVNIPNSVKTIPATAFANCSSLTSMDIPNSVTKIGSCAFMYCRLSSITIPSSVTSIGVSAFDDIWTLSDVTVEWAEPLEFNLYEEERIFLTPLLANATLHVPAGTADKYREAEVWKDFGNIEEYELTDIHQIEDGTLNVLNGKYLKDGRIVIKKAGKDYTLDGKLVY